MDKEDMVNSTHKVEIIKIENIEEHPNADNLEIIIIWGYSVCVKKGVYKVGDLAAYIVPDSLVPLSHPYFQFLQKEGENKEKYRIRVVRFRNILSQGLLVPAPEGSNIGDDVAEQLGVTRYITPIDLRMGDSESGPDAPKYDVESAHRYAKEILVKGEPLWIVEKIHGANARFMWREDRMWCGSRSQWKKRDDNSPWWVVHKKYPVLEEFCRSNPDCIVYGEVYGNIQDLNYGHTKGQVSLAVFDIMRRGQWLDPEIARGYGKKLPWVPLVHRFKTGWTFEELFAMADRDSEVEGANHCAEGIVIKLLKERFHPSIGRIQLKIVSNRYLERK